MFASGLACRGCHSVYPLENLYSCAKCGGILEVIYQYPVGLALICEPDVNFFGMWKYRALLPVKHEENIVTLGEGDTPLLKTERLPDLWGAELELYIKAEMLNPSGSFKDRPTSVAVSVAKENGYDKIVVASSGNASAAAAAYAARASMECVVFIPESTDINKVAQAQSYGANVICVRGSFSRAYDMAMDCTRRYGWANVTSTFINPYTVEGDKVPAYELFHQLKGRVPDYILVPIGCGPLLVGIYKGFRELLAMNLINKLPAMVGVQVKQCEPITQAFERGGHVRSWTGDIHTVAGGIADPLIGYEGDGELTLSTVKESGGVMLSLDEGELLAAHTEIEQNVGLYVEPTGATAVGAAKKLINQGFIRSGSLVVSVLTGHGFKYSGRVAQSPPVVSDISQLKTYLG